MVSYSTKNRNVSNLFSKHQIKMKYEVMSNRLGSIDDILRLRAIDTRALIRSCWCDVYKNFEFIAVLRPETPIPRNTNSQHGAVFQQRVSGSRNRFTPFRSGDGWFNQLCLTDYHITRKRLNYGLRELQNKFTI